MCGIAGIVHFDGSMVDQSELDLLTDALAHRGSSGRGTSLQGSVGLGHRRLSILDLSDAARQPMFSGDRNLTLIFNGEIYNFAEKRRMLEDRGYTFSSTGDSEVLLALYEEFGEACLEHLRGMFAFAIYDRKKQVIFLARDRLGKKPLKYFFHQKRFVFASELKALRTLSDCPRDIDAEAIHHYLTMMYVPAPQTGIVGIQKLQAGHCMTIDLHTAKVMPKRYWQLTYQTDQRTSLDQWKQKIFTLFDESVRLRMVADVPVGAFLSGGIDSAAVVALMSRHARTPVKTFSIGTSRQTHNELPDALRIATLLNTDHHPVVLEPDIVHLLPELVRTYEEPYADPSSIPTYLVAKYARQYVTVALNGDGGDENFAGYVRYPILRFSQSWSRYPFFLHLLARLGTEAYHALARSTLSYRMRRFEHSVSLPWPQRYLQYLSFFTEDEKKQLYLSGFGSHFPRTDFWYSQRTATSRGAASDLIHQAMSMDIHTYLSEDLMPKVDLGSMAHGLEARSPFLDHNLLELTSQLPIDYQLKGYVRKWILKDIFKDILPSDTLWKKKTGFRLPLDSWFRHDLRSFVDDRLLAGESKLWRFFDRTRMQDFLMEYRTSRIDYSDHIWSLLWLDEWLRQYS